MPMLEDKLKQELKTDSAVIACRFPLPNWIPTASVDEGLDTVWLYEPHKSMPKAKSS